MPKEKSINEEDFHLIEAYLDNQIDDLKASEVTRRLREDSNFRNTFEELKSLRDYLEIAFLKESMNDFHKEIIPVYNTSQTSTSTSKKPLFYILPVAAVVLISLGLFWFLKPNSNKQIFNQFFSPDPGLPTVMSEQSNFQFYDGMVNYKREEYEQAIHKWMLLLKENSQNDTLNYFIGMAYMASEQETNAVPFIDKVIDNENSAFWEDAKYYKALYLVKNNEIDVAITLLKELEESAKAQSLLKEIKNND